MGASVFVKVVGFADAERHALNTIFRLAHDQEPNYTLWLPDSPLPAHVALIDMDSHEADIALASPGLNPSLKILAVGKKPMPAAWRTFTRPLNWPDVVAALNSLFQPVDFDFTSEDNPDTVIDVAPGFKVALLIDDVRDNRLYLRARLALAGLVTVQDETSAAQGLAQARLRRYDAVFISLQVPDAEGWRAVEQLVALEPAIGSVVLIVHQADWQVRERAEQLGCAGVLSCPFDPVEVQRLLLKI